jgi:hypothetical protein
VFAIAAVRGCGGSAGESRQVLIEATVVCPGLPRIPWQHFFLLARVAHYGERLVLEHDFLVRKFGIVGGKIRIA